MEAHPVPEFSRKNIRLPAERYLGLRWYFLTLVTEGRAKSFGDARLVQEALRQLTTQAESHGFAILAYCFMPDHLHLLATGTVRDSNLLKFAAGFRQVSAYHFKQQTGERLWQKKYFDHILRADDKWESVASYIWSNPVRRRLCTRAEQWPFSGSFTVDWRRLMSLEMDPWTPPWKKA